MSCVYCLVKFNVTDPVSVYFDRLFVSVYTVVHSYNFISFILLSCSIILIMHFILNFVLVLYERCLCCKKMQPLNVKQIFVST